MRGPVAVCREHGSENFGFLKSNELSSSPAEELFKEDVSWN
jgi:hypothetical protein